MDDATENALVSTSDTESPVYVVCMVHPKDFNEARARWQSFDWTSGPAYVRAVHERADELYDAGEDVEIAILDIASYRSWCAFSSIDEDSSASRRTWAQHAPRYSYLGNLGSVLLYFSLVETLRPGLALLNPVERTRLDERVGALFDELGAIDEDRGVLSAVVYDGLVDAPQRREHPWTWLVEWVEDEDGRWLSALDVSENDSIVALFIMGLLYGGSLELMVVCADAEDFPVTTVTQWILGPSAGDGLFVKVERA